MPDRTISPDPEKARNLLDQLWKEVLSEEPLHVVEGELYSLIDSQFVSIRYCLPTQLLGKLVDHSLDCLCLQKGDGSDPRAWDPRGFCNKTIVSWVSENQNVLGTSSDPYVSKPLRKPRLEASPGNVKGAEQWTLLYNTLASVEQNDDPNYTRVQFIEVLRCLRNKFSDLVFEYFIPKRVSLKQVTSIIQRFLSESSGGDRGLSVAAALFETFGEYFNLYSSVVRHAINVADTATGTTADIECYGLDDGLKLAIEVKERDLTLIDVRSAINKARRASLRELLFNAPGSKSSEEIKIQELINRTWASGTNLYRLTIEDLIQVGLSLTGEDGRIYFLKKVGEQLDKYNTQPANRKRWKELLENL